MTTTRQKFLMDRDIRTATRCFDLSPVLERHGSWAVTTFGVECLEYSYWISFDRVDESDWFDHMRGKFWVKLGDFARALEAGRRRHAAMRRTASNPELALAA